MYTCSVALQDRIKWMGRVAALCFVIQAGCNIGNVVGGSEQLEGWTVCFFAANVLALVCVLSLFCAGVAKVTKIELATLIAVERIPNGVADRSSSDTEIMSASAPSTSVSK